MDSEICAPAYSLLPAHVITQILGYLKLSDFKNASCVSKSWYYASTDPQIARTLILKPTQDNFVEICKSNRRYGVLKLQFLAFDKTDSHYFGLFDKFGPFVSELHINNCDLRIHHLLKLFELTTRLKLISISECNQLVELPGLFPLEYDSEAKHRIIKNLSGVKTILIEYFGNMHLIADLLRWSPNLETFSNELVQFDEEGGLSYRKILEIFNNDNAASLKHLHLVISLKDYADNFITSFIKIKNLYLKSLRIELWWSWEGGIYKSFLFRQFILKLQSLEELMIDRLIQDQLSLICQYLLNLKSLDCRLRDDHQSISELANLNQLKKLRCRLWDGTHLNSVDIDKFFKCKFAYLQLFHFEGLVSEANLIQFCENHPNLIELKLARLMTRNLQIIFKYLIKLRSITIYFKVSRDEDENRDYEYNILRLQELEELYLSELVNGICENDLGQLKNLRSTNLPELFDTARDRTTYETNLYRDELVDLPEHIVLK